VAVKDGGGQRTGSQEDRAAQQRTRNLGVATSNQNEGRDSSTRAHNLNEKAG